ncbi:MAG: GIDE domain-containing protein, partial [Burkholderiales bacterium]
MEWFIPFIPWTGGLLSLGCLLAAFRNYRRKRLTEALPTSRALGVFIGLVEMKGVAECERPLRSRLAEATCVHYEWTIEEQWRRTETQTVTDSDGKSRSKTNTSSGWTNVGSGGESVASFYVKDATGAILVHPQGADMDPQVVFNRTCSPDDAVYHDKGPASGIADSTHRRRFTEKAIRLHGPVYIVGKAREREDVVAAEIAQDEHAPLFLISGRTERDVQASYFLRAALWSAGGLALLIAGLIVWDMSMTRDLYARRPFYFKFGGAYLGAWLLAWVWNVFNDLISLRNRVREG